jgi:chromosome segregation ATPase
VNIAQLESQIAEKKQVLAGLQQSHSQSSSLASQLHEHRGKHIVAARAHKDESAQQKIREIDGEIGHAKQDTRDDEHAISEITAELSALEAQLATAQHEAERQAVLAMLERRAKSKIEARIAKAAQEIKSALREHHEEMRAIAPAAAAFAPQDQQVIGQAVERMNKLIADLIAYELRGCIETNVAQRDQFLESQDFSQVAPRVMERIAGWIREAA